MYRTHVPSYICSNKVSSSSTIFCKLSGSFSRGNGSLVEGFGRRWTTSSESLLPGMTTKPSYRELKLPRSVESQDRVPEKCAAHAERAGSDDAPRVLPLNRGGFAVAAVPKASRVSSPSGPVGQYH